MRLRPAAAALAALLLVSCTGGKGKSSSTPTLPVLQQTTTSALPATPVLARVLSPEKGSVQGTGGRGMVVVLTFSAKDASALVADFRLGGSLPAPAAAVKPGHNPAFPGLVVALSTTGPALGGPTANLANLFQIISPSKQPDGSVQVAAVWTNAQAGFGTDTDVTLGTFTVAGTAPDVVPTTPADLNLTSNPAQVTFHLSADDGAGSSTSSTTSPGSTTTAKASTSTTKPITTVPPSTTTSKATTTTVVPATTTTTKFLGLF